MPPTRTDRIAAARRKLEQAKASLQLLEAREVQEARKRDTRRKIILGGLLLDAAAKEPRFATLMSELIGRISRPQDKAAFADGTLISGAAPVSDAASVTRVSIR